MADDPVTPEITPEVMPKTLPEITIAKRPLLPRILRWSALTILFCIPFLQSIAIWNTWTTNRLHANNPVPGQFFLERPVRIVTL